MLLNLREILEPAVKDNFAVGGFNVTESTMFKAIVEEAQYREAPAIIQVSPNEFQFSERELYLYFSVRLQRSRNPFVLHYDHSKSYEGCIRAIQAGFTSVMFDGSQMEYDQNVECTRRVVEAAHGAGVSVEGEIGTIGETEDYLNGTVRDMVYTSPELARRFVEDTGVDALAVSIGTVHGILPKGYVPKLQLGLLKELNQGYMNNTYRIPSKEFKDFQRFQRREVAKLAKEMVDITHECGKEAMMFLGDHWIGTEPFMDEFQTIGLDAVVGSVGNGSTLRLISDIEGVSYTEGRFLPYFFPDTFHEGGDPVKEAKVNWVTARRAILRKPIDRIGYGGYLKLAMQFPDFIDYVESVCQEFRTLYNNIKGTTPYCVKRVAVLNSWGKMRAWGNHMVHHAIYYKQNYSYAGIIEALSGAPFDVKFISFDDIRENPDILKDIDVILNVGGAYTAYSGGENWADEKILTAVKRFVYEGGGFIGVGEPTACQREGRYFQLSGVMGVEKENGFTLNVDKYNWEEHEHFITEDCRGDVDFGEGQKSIFAFPETTIIKQTYKEVQLAANDFGDGRSVYISGLPYSFENSRLLYRAILWSSHDEENLHKWFSENYNVEVHAYVKNGKYCVVNNTYEPQDTVVYKGDGSSFALHLEANEIIWYEI